MMDVSDQILQHHRIYGSSDYTASHATSSSRALNYANGGSIQKPEEERVTTLPRKISFKDSVGLFGSENYFVKVNMRIQNPVSGCYEEAGWECARTSGEEMDPADPYTYLNTGDAPGQAYIDEDADPDIVNTYEPAQFLGNTINNITNAAIKIDLKNLKTGNTYIDSWLDIRLYNKNKEEHPYDVMYVSYIEPFYIGFHARNTRRLPYNVSCEIGINTSNLEADGLLPKEIVDPRLLATKR